MNYSEVPKILTSKDLDYLSDMFNWNYNTYKMISNINVNDNEINEVFNHSKELLNSSMNQILNIIGGMNENK